jgi:hypothetical protein
MNIADNLILPPMHMVEQRFSVPPAVDVTAEIEREWNKIKDRINIAGEARIAVGVGSRGIANLVEAVRAVVVHLKAAGTEPFIIPAMGSHGGATAEGQVQVLSHLGITEEAVGAPVVATMDVQPMGEVGGIPLFLDQLAYKADGIVLINRVKLHTDFSGPTESGIIKMMAIGLGNQVGADHYHRLAVVRDMFEIFNRVGMTLIEQTNFLFSLGLVENQSHQTCIVKMATAGMLPKAEEELLTKARQYFPRLPLDEIDLLIIDEIGKDISGNGMDPKVTGRVSSPFVQKPPGPNVTRIFVRDLTDVSEGNAIGIGDADFTTRRLVEKIDAHKTAMNCVTACGPEGGRIPLNYSTDREAIAAALMTIRPYTLDDLKIVHIKNTLELKIIMVSRGCLADLVARPDVSIDRQDIQLEFDSHDNLISKFK